jgi:hypothetical protein
MFWLCSAFWSLEVPVYTLSDFFALPPDTASYPAKSPINGLTPTLHQTPRPKLADQPKLNHNCPKHQF